MWKVSLLVILGLFCVSCNEYIAAKREGLKPFDDPSERQAEEDPNSVRK